MKKKKSVFARAIACLAGVLGVAIIPEISYAAGMSWCAGLSGMIQIAGVSVGGGASTGNGCGGAGGIASALCTIVDWFTVGGVGAAVASIAVIFMGIAAFFGKVTWGMALTTACGIFAIFGAGDIVAAIVGPGMGMTQC